ncbi:MAG TPA: lipid-A-disaccharide synthase [Gammaproteobacteria bacterium]|jgi:lipid-A-disaccharide synthase|nr:lipid-A-disaccharide synthase [Gammaproteobacteria bacterium]
MRIGIVAGESSGDILGAGLIRAIKARVPEARFEGVAGPAMVAAGCEALYPAETLAVMGLAEVLVHLPRLLKVRAHLRRHFIQDPPDLFIGVDSPDFNLGLEQALRRRGIPTVHYVSPSIWAWRPKRVFKVGKAADLTLALLPFEPPLYEKHGFKSVFVGHPLADTIPEHPDRAALRRELHLGEDDWVVALLPGSRFSEVERLGRLFLETAQWLNLEQPRLRFVIPAATPALNRMLKELIRTTQPDLPVTLVEGHSHDVLGAADAVLLASGTAALEALLFKCPMVVAYKLSAASHAFIRFFDLLKIPYVSLPNLLAGRALVPEFLQREATPEAMGAALLRLLEDGPARDAQVQGLAALTGTLRRGADQRAAEAVLALLDSRRSARV